jgi:hypothetical protein
LILRFLVKNFNQSFKGLRTPTQKHLIV